VRNRAIVAPLLITAVWFGSSVHAITIDTVPVGNAGNSPDTRYIGGFHPNDIGSVAQSFNMGATEVTNAQYVAFLNAVAASDTYGLYKTVMATSPWAGIVRNGSSGHYSYVVKAPALGGSNTYDNKPVDYVDPGNAMRFANWLHNGQPNGPQNTSTTESGAYSLNGATGDSSLSKVTRNAGARWWLPSENEWYKAAYFDGEAGTYYDYPTGTNSVPNNNLPSSDTGNSADFSAATGNGDYPLTDAGAYSLSASPYGTFDQGGNVWEWSDTVVSGKHIVSGGSWQQGADHLEAEYRVAFPVDSNYHVGFRVASMQQPGDFNGNGTVDAADYAVWRHNNGSAADYNLWRTHFGQSITGSGTSLAGTAAVPEPSSLALLFGAAFILLAASDRAGVTTKSRCRIRRIGYLLVQSIDRVPAYLRPRAPGKFCGRA
jgi:sulfatase modifying factor 1